MFDEALDSEEQLGNLSLEKPDCFVVAEVDGRLIGTVTVFEDGRACWLYRFAYQDDEIGQVLWNQARQVAKKRGHNQVLVYAPTGDRDHEQRYHDCGFHTGNSYTAYWQDIEYTKYTLHKRRILVAPATSIRRLWLIIYCRLRAIKVIVIQYRYE